MGPLASRAATPKKFSAPLPIPEVLTDSALELEMTEAEVPILPGAPTQMWTYGGSFPGPTIRRPAGTETQVTFTHSLPDEAGELTVHLHGGHNPSDHDASRVPRRPIRRPASATSMDPQGRATTAHS